MNIDHWGRQIVEYAGDSGQESAVVVKKSVDEHQLREKFLNVHENV